MFNQLFTLANMPIQRFGSMLVSKGQFNSYMSLLRSAHREDNLEQVMCRSLVSVDWLGYLYDCDFNQQLGLPIRDAGKPRVHLGEITAGALDGQPIRVAEPLLRLHRRPGLQLRRRAGGRHGLRTHLRHLIEPHQSRRTT